MDVNEGEFDIYTQDEDKCVRELVKAVLILDHLKKPFKQNDLAKYLNKKLNRKEWSSVFEKCKAKLKELGLNLMEVEQTNAKVFFLVSNVFPMPSMYKFADDNETADRTLLILVLTFIFMKEAAVTSDDIFNHLQQLNIYNEKNPMHDYFGDVKKKILNDFVSQLYLEKKILDKETMTVELSWGERATAEISKKSILEFVCEIGYEGAIQPKNLASQYKAAVEEENETNSGESNESELMVIDN